MTDGTALEVTWVLPDGRVGGPLPDGGVVRLWGAVPGDVVRIRALRRSGTTVDGELEAIVTPSPYRIAPICPHSAACGGCDLDALDPTARGEVLGRTVARAFRWDGEVAFLAAPGPTGWRARIKLAIAGGVLGYHAHRSHALVPVERCGIARPEIEVLHGRLRTWLAADPTRGDAFSEVELRSDGQRAVAAFRTKDGKGRVPANVREHLPELVDVAVDGRTVVGTPTLTLTVAGLSLRASPASFYQVHLEQNARLVERVRAAVRDAGAERVLDLYAGIGNFGLPLAAGLGGIPVVAVESPGAAAEDLRYNAKTLGLPVEVVAVRAERFEPSRTPYDAVVLDPPREGAPGVIERVARSRPKVIVYVSCHAPSAARDLRSIRGYTLASVAAVDLFPGTHHVEAVAVLVRTGR